ncbi:MAG TPA: AIR synthase-related protein [Candidatus Nanoarchaeia archaeon]|nr:AIR synthase-related protein [Candidatus Nanoarchaeia archaeon]
MYDPSKPYKEQILKMIQSTWKTPYVTVRQGTYPIIERRISLPEVDHTDGIGTKGKHIWKMREFTVAVQDALAMNLNDLALCGAKTYKLQNHLMIHEDDHDAILDIISALSDSCVRRGIAITGGETSVQGNLEGMDLSLTVSGFITNQKENKAEIGDIVIGLRSSGLHANGFTFVNSILGNDIRREYVIPTMIYSHAILDDYILPQINGMMHITGGAFTKLKGMLDSSASIAFRKDHEIVPHNIFFEIYDRGKANGVTDEQMYRTLNCGIGFILTAKPASAQTIINAISEKYGFIARAVGEVIPGNRNIHIPSKFSDVEVTL